MVKRGKYNYPNQTGDFSLVDKKIKEDFIAFCKDKKINKGKLIENFFKAILLRFKDGSLAASSGYITLNIFAK